MQNKKQLVVGLLVVFFIISSNESKALTVEEITPRGENAKVLGLQTNSLLEQIAHAKQMLVGEKLHYTITPVLNSKKRVSGYTVPSKELAVAILDPATNTIKITKAIQKDTKFTFPDKNFVIQTLAFNGVNTRFKVHEPKGGVVLALKYLITKDGSTRQDVTNKLYEGIYVPYSTELRTPETIAEGQAYLNSVIAQAAHEIRHAKSHSQPGKFLPEAIPQSHIKALVYAEHVSMWEYNNIPRIELIHKINTLFGTNKNDTYKYSVSSAGASGLAQFMPKTYASLVKRRKELTLKPDFVEGMRDHVNAIKAMYGLLDDYGSTVRTLSKDAYMSEYAFDYAAAAYNGGPVKVARAANRYGHTWNTLQPDNHSSLKNETVNYVVKIRGFIQTISEQ